jgi:hypothetical protein
MQQIHRPYRWSALRTLRTIADPIGRAETIGRPVLWRLKTFHCLNWGRAKKPPEIGMSIAAQNASKFALSVCPKKE